MRNSRITDAYAQRRDDLATTFPAAHRFLVDLEGEPSVCLDTEANANVYGGDDGFVASLQIDSPEGGPSSLLLSPRFDGPLADGAKDRSSLLFPTIIEQLLARRDGVWWRRRAGGAIELASNTPRIFFLDLRSALVDACRS